MRVRASKALRVSPGDEVIVTGSLPNGQRLGRLFVFAKEGDVEFSPYVYNVEYKMALPNNEPRAMSPMTMRLTERKRQDQLTFFSDIDGFLVVMQEVDRPDDIKANITLKRKVCPDLPLTQKIGRHISGLLAWTN